MQPDDGKSIFRIESTLPGRNFGTGFCVYEDQASTLVVTCQHVLDDVGGAAHGNIQGFGIAETFADRTNKVADMVVVVTAARLEAKPLPLCDVAREGDPIVIIGYERLSPGFIRRSFRGRLLNPIELELEGSCVPGWDLLVESDIGLVGGYSGSPVFHGAANCVVGMITRHYADHKRVIAIGTPLIEKLVAQTRFSGGLSHAAPPAGRSAQGFAPDLHILGELAKAAALNKTGLDARALGRKLHLDSPRVVRSLSALKREGCILERQRLGAPTLYTISAKGRRRLQGDGQS